MTLPKKVLGVDAVALRAPECPLFLHTPPRAQDPVSVRDQNEFCETSAKDPPKSIPFDNGDSCEKSHYTNLSLPTFPLAHRTAASTRNKCVSPENFHDICIRQASLRSQASPAVILVVGSAFATLGSTTGTTPADPRATPYLPSPSIIPLAPPPVLLPLDRVRCLGSLSTAPPPLSRPIARSTLGSPPAIPIPILPLTKILVRS
ncbi:hypothetical protein DFH08DRAFT_969973 [Mycena albidolilacea]|uniref:Uncharacterized protein n=1 Tax=Mycena albidolilacea TaxID=1033008 RepID=A0AAD6ZGT8_9AGAR|nr:hypothetical protein DFH08DRAFT_969973 [Mycena albidolilacea]